MSVIDNLIIRINVEAPKSLKSIRKIVCPLESDGSKQAIDELRIELI